MVMFVMFVLVAIMGVVFLDSLSLLSGASFLAGFRTTLGTNTSTLHMVPHIGAVDGKMPAAQVRKSFDGFGPALVDMGDEREDERIDEWLWLTVAGLYYTVGNGLAGTGK